MKREDLQPIVDKVIKTIACWKGRLLSYAGRLTLLKACLANIPIYLLSIIKFSKWAIELINSQMEHFLWNNNETNCKYHLVNWQPIAQFGELATNSSEKRIGDFGIPI